MLMRGDRTPDRGRLRRDRRDARPRPGHRGDRDRRSPILRRAAERQHRDAVPSRWLPRRALRAGAVEQRRLPRRVCGSVRSTRTSWTNPWPCRSPCTEATRAARNAWWCWICRSSSDDSRPSRDVLPAALRRARPERSARRPRSASAGARTSPVGHQCRVQGAARSGSNVVAVQLGLLLQPSEEGLRLRLAAAGGTLPRRIARAVLEPRVGGRARSRHR